MTLSFNKLNEIAELYESIAASEQEQLDEGYISEQGQRPGTRSTASQTNQSVSLAPIGNAARSVISGVSNSFSRANSVPNSGGSRNMRGGGTTPAATKPAPAPARPATQAPAPARPATQAPAPARPATQAPAPARPATQAPAKPATPAPTPTSAKTSPTSTLSQATAAASKPPAFSPKPQSDVGAMIARSRERQDAQAPKPVVKPAPKPAAPGAGRDYLMKRQLNQNFDVFDAVLGHLIDEGYADTEEAATAIMANMSEDWRESIVEEVFGEDKKYDANRKRAAQRAAARNAARDAGKTGAVPGVGYVTPRRESETYRDSAGVERHKSGAKNA